MNTHFRYPTGCFAFPSAVNSTQVFAFVFSCASALGDLASHKPTAHTPNAHDNPTNIRMFIDFLALGNKNAGERQPISPNRTFQLVGEMLTPILKRFCHVDDNAFGFQRIVCIPACSRGGRSLGFEL
jgi:hypothetical protein